MVRAHGSVYLVGTMLRDTSKDVWVEYYCTEPSPLQGVLLKEILYQVLIPIFPVSKSQYAIYPLVSEYLLTSLGRQKGRALSWGRLLCGRVYSSVADADLSNANCEMKKAKSGEYSKGRTFSAGSCRADEGPGQTWKRLWAKGDDGCKAIKLLCHKKRFASG